MDLKQVDGVGGVGQARVMHLFSGRAVGGTCSACSH